MSEEHMKFSTGFESVDRLQEMKAGFYVIAGTDYSLSYDAPLLKECFTGHLIDHLSDMGVPVLLFADENLNGGRYISKNMINHRQSNLDGENFLLDDSSDYLEDNTGYEDDYDDCVANGDIYCIEDADKYQWYQNYQEKLARFQRDNLFFIDCSHGIYRVELSDFRFDMAKFKKAVHRFIDYKGVKPVVIIDDLIPFCEDTQSGQSCISGFPDDIYKSIKMFQKRNGLVVIYTTDISHKYELKPVDGFDVFKEDPGLIEYADVIWTLQPSLFYDSSFVRYYDDEKGRYMKVRTFDRAVKLMDTIRTNNGLNIRLTCLKNSFGRTYSTDGLWYVPSERHIEDVEVENHE